MTNEQIAEKLKWYADLSELHNGNPFKIKSYAAASFRIDKLLEPLAGKSIAELEQIEGVGKSVAAKVFQLSTTGTFDELQQLEQDTPLGVQQLFAVKGIGPKKIAYIWQQLGIESIGELLYACNENRLAQAKGFGLKTQESVKKSIEFIFANTHKFHYAKIEELANQLVDALNEFDGTTNISLTGAIRRKCEVIETIEICVAIYGDENELAQYIDERLSPEQLQVNTSTITFVINQSIPCSIYFCSDDDFFSTLFETTATAAHLQLLKALKPDFTTAEATSEEVIYTSVNLPYIAPELREGLHEVSLARQNKLPKLIEITDLKGILHNHSTYSDGLNTLAEMANYCKELGYEYLGICDHSKAAQYAGGLKEEEIIKQHEEIELLNKKLAPFFVFKGIECDILGDGSLDYSNDVLASFDFIVASVHSNLKMTEEKAMSRLIKAIENPYTTLLGHPTGRLLLMREGYPIDHHKIIDACAANEVVIEINAHPYRLDLDWRYIDYALNKGVKLSINPDAHHTQGYHNMYYGVCVARKGGLYKEMCLNAMSFSEINAYFLHKKPK
ncbi:MAG: DNA polymerase/3'-5' exonuclease PolX [Bacteroidetes bacterium]|nr:MAG: DNA polymerase/3'-5' exonuclease PolX [Bacteroidota bacterium]